jgi:oxalate/formate antiporter
MVQVQDIPAAIRRARLWQLVLGVVAMMAVSSPQYVWALFVPPALKDLKASLPALQVTIALFSIFQAGFGPLHGWLSEKIKPSLFIAFGGLLVGVSWVASSFVHNLTLFYVTYGVLSGLGAGFVFVPVTSLMARWFPDRRGFAVGMVAGSYGMGAVVTTFPIDMLIKAYDFRTALLAVGVVLGVVGLLAGAGMREPPSEIEAYRPQVRGAAQRDYTPGEMLKTPAFWLLFLMMTMVGTGGLMAISNVAVFAKSFGIGPTVTVMGLAALPLALTLDRICNGVSRPLFGWVSDHIGREPTMALTFTVGAAATVALLHFGHDPVLFVVLTGLVFLGWGEIFSLFPSAQADLFGTRHGGKNFGFLFISIAVASLLGGPLAAFLFEQTKSWATVFYTVSGLDLLAAVMALLVLRPMRLRAHAAGGLAAAAAPAV